MQLAPCFLIKAAAKLRVCISCNITVFSIFMDAATFCPFQDLDQICAFYATASVVIA